VQLLHGWMIEKRKFRAPCEYRGQVRQRGRLTAARRSDQRDDAAEAFLNQLGDDVLQQ
jgi:hypothetical protein